MRAAAGALAIVLMAIVAGCGSDRLSANELRVRATHFCTLAGRETTRIPTPSSPNGGSDFLQLGLAALEPELARLRKLRPPTVLSKLYSNAIDASGRELAAMRATLSELHAGANPVNAMAALQQRLAPLEAVENTAWRGLGIPACVSR